MDWRTRTFRPFPIALGLLAMTDSRWWLVCYDVRDPKRLRRCAEHMEGYGVRVQYSVFRCWMSETEVQRLRWELMTILTPEDDVLLIPICSRCLEAIMNLSGDSRPPDWDREPPRHEIF